MRAGVPSIFSRRCARYRGVGLQAGCGAEGEAWEVGRGRPRSHAEPVAAPQPLLPTAPPPLTATACTPPALPLGCQCTAPGSSLEQSGCWGRWAPGPRLSRRGAGGGGGESLMMRGCALLCMLSRGGGAGWLAGAVIRLPCLQCMCAGPSVAPPLHRHAPVRGCRVAGLSGGGGATGRSAQMLYLRDGARKPGVRGRAETEQASRRQERRSSVQGARMAHSVPQRNQPLPLRPAPHQALGSLSSSRISLVRWPLGPGTILPACTTTERRPVRG